MTGAASDTVVVIWPPSHDPDTDSDWHLRRAAHRCGTSTRYAQRRTATKVSPTTAWRG